MKIIKKVTKNIIWALFMLSIFSLYFVLGHETGCGIFGILALITLVLMTGIYKPIIRLIKDIKKQIEE